MMCIPSTILSPFENIHVFLHRSGRSLGFVKELIDEAKGTQKFRKGFFYIVNIAPLHMYDAAELNDTSNDEALSVLSEIAGAAGPA